MTEEVETWPSRSVEGDELRLRTVVHHDTGRRVQFDLEDTTYDRLVVGCADPETVAARLGGVGP